MYCVCIIPTTRQNKFGSFFSCLICAVFSCLVRPVPFITMETNAEFLYSIQWGAPEILLKCTCLNREKCAPHFTQCEPGYLLSTGWISMASTQSAWRRWPLSEVRKLLHNAALLSRKGKNIHMTPGPTAPDVGILAIQIIDSTLLQNAFKERQPLSILS